MILKTLNYDVTEEQIDEEGSDKEEDSEKEEEQISLLDKWNEQMEIIKSEYKSSPTAVKSLVLMPSLDIFAKMFLVTPPTVV